MKKYIVTIEDFCCYERFNKVFVATLSEEELLKLKEFDGKKFVDVSGYQHTLSVVVEEVDYYTYDDIVAELKYTL